LFFTTNKQLTSYNAIQWNTISQQHLGFEYGQQRDPGSLIPDNIIQGFLYIYIETPFHNSLQSN